MLGAMSGDETGGGPVRRPKMIEWPQLPPGPLADLKALIYELYVEAGAPSLDKIATWIARDGDLDAIVGRDTVHRIIGGPAMPASQAHMAAVVTVLARAARWNPQDAAGRARDLWVTARMASTRYPAAGIQVSQADPRRLGVHAAISVPGVPDGIPPEYVPRDADDGESGVRAKVAAAARRGGFVLLVGGSSVGKTRCAFEAVTVLLPDWWLVHPAGTAEVVALASAPTPRTVVWLDELQRYLDGEHGLTGGLVRALLNAPHPAVIIGTLWPDRYTAYTTPPTPGGVDPYAREREVLDLATVIRIAPEFSEAEQGRAHAAAARDRRLRVALGAAGYGLTQTLAAAPQLAARWQDAKTASPYAWAVLTAALDASRLGARAPLTIDFLRAAAPGYCTSVQQAEAPDNWFEQALAYATEKLHGAVAALNPAGAGMAQVVGYTAADYLIQHASRERRYERVPASTWETMLSHIRDPDDAARLAGRARNRLLYRYAIPLYRHAADAGDEVAAGWLAELLAQRHDLDGLRALADARGGYAAWRLADLLAQRGDTDEAVLVLRALADAGDGHGAWRLADLLAQRGDTDEAVLVLRARADVGDWQVAERLAKLLTIERDNVVGLRARADAGDGFAAWQLTNLLAGRGDLEELRARADAGDRYAARRLADLLAQRGNLDRLRARADAGDKDAAGWVAKLLAKRGDLGGLRARADAGETEAAGRLDWQLAERGNLEELRARANAGDKDAAGWVADLLARQSDLDGLRARADDGDGHAAWRLAELLAKRGDLDGLRARTDDGDGHAAQRLAELLADQLVKQGRGQEAEQLHQFGLNPDGSIARK